MGSPVQDKAAAQAVDWSLTMAGYDSILASAAEAAERLGAASNIGKPPDSDGDSDGDRDGVKEAETRKGKKVIVPACIVVEAQPIIVKLHLLVMIWL
jgi:hypothetical protein